MLKAKQSFAVGRRVIRRGQVVAADDPAVKGREALFTSELVEAEPVVERATAAPGEKRVTKPRSGKKTSKR
jgi:hypothetical protein